jgi:uncharacterized membrane protein
MRSSIDAAQVRGQATTGHDKHMMTKYLIAFISAAIVFGVLDALWLRWAGENFYRPVIGEIMADEFRAAPAAVFYFLYLIGMTYFAIRPGLEAGSAMTALINGVLLGALCYATYDLTSQAVLKVWATKISVVDIMWGAFATGTSSALATWITLRFTS